MSFVYIFVFLCFMIVIILVGVIFKINSPLPNPLIRYLPTNLNLTPTNTTDSIIRLNTNLNLNIINTIIRDNNQLTPNQFSKYGNPFLNISSPVTPVNLVSNLSLKPSCICGGIDHLTKKNKLCKFFKVY